MSVGFLHIVFSAQCIVYPLTSRFGWLVCSDGGLHSVEGLAQQETPGCSIFELLPLPAPLLPPQNRIITCQVSSTLSDYICALHSSRLAPCSANIFCSLQFCSGLAAEPLAWLGTWCHGCFLHVPSWFFCYCVFEISSLYSCSTLKIPTLCQLIGLDRSPRSSATDCVCSGNDYCNIFSSTY